MSVDREGLRRVLRAKARDALIVEPALSCIEPVFAEVDRGFLLTPGQFPPQYEVAQDLSRSLGTDIDALVFISLSYPVAAAHLLKDETRSYLLHTQICRALDADVQPLDSFGQQLGCTVYRKLQIGLEAQAIETYGPELGTEIGHVAKCVIVGLLGCYFTFAAEADMPKARQIKGVIRRLPNIIPITALNEQPNRYLCLVG